MLRPPPRSTRTDTLFPDTTLFRSKESVHGGIALRKGAERYPQKYPLCSRLVPYPPGFDRTVIAQKSAEISRFLDVLGRPRKNKWCPEEDSNLHDLRSEEHTSELQSLMRISYAVFCLKKKKKIYTQTLTIILTSINTSHLI